MKKWVPVFLVGGLLCALAVPALAAGTSGSGLPAVSRLEPIYHSPVPDENITVPIIPISPIEELPAASSSGGKATDVPETNRQPGQGTVRDIDRYWEENGYPDHVAYACETGSEIIGDMAYSWWEIGLVEGSETDRQEILGLCSPFCLVEFKSALYPYKERAEAYDRLTQLARNDGNILQVIFSRCDDRVWAVVPEALEEYYAGYLVQDCGLGEVVQVTDEDSAAGLEGGTAPAAPEDGAEEGLQDGVDGGPDLLTRFRLFLPFAGVTALTLAALKVNGRLRISLPFSCGRKRKDGKTRNKTIDE